jgi:hypothetical protein
MGLEAGSKFRWWLCWGHSQDLPIKWQPQRGAILLAALSSTRQNKTLFGKTLEKWQDTGRTEEKTFLARQENFNLPASVVAHTSAC